MGWDLKTARDAVMFIIGSGGFAHEVIITEGERPTLLLACLALMGVPFFLRRDESESESSNPPSTPQLPPSEQPAPPTERRSR